MLGTADSLFQSKAEIVPQNAQLVLFTDGLMKARSPGGEEFGPKRLMPLLKTTQGLSAKRITELIINAVNDFRQTAAQQDDITVFALVNHK